MRGSSAVHLRVQRSCSRTCLTATQMIYSRHNRMGGPEESRTLPVANDRVDNARRRHIDGNLAYVPNGDRAVWISLQSDQSI